MAPRSAVPALLAVALLGGGCADNRGSFFIQQVQVPSDDCVIEPDEGGLYQTSGVLDIAFRSNYVLTPLLRNNMSARAEPESYVAETNGIQVEGANVRIWRGGRPEGATIYSFYQPAASYVAPQGMTASSFVVVPDVAVDSLLRIAYEGADPGGLEFGDLLPYDELITVGVVMLGTTNGNQEVETPEFFFPVRLCFGCLVFCPADAADPEADPPAPLCENPEPPEGSTCLFGQHDAIDCRWATPIYEAPNARLFCAN